MKLRLFFLFLLCSFFICGLAQQPATVFKVKYAGEEKNQRMRPSIQLDRFWKYHKGDDLRWADSSLNDADWKELKTNLNLDTLPPGTFEKIGWFRIHLWIDTSLLNKDLGLMMYQLGASEIYLDGKLVKSFGKVYAGTSDLEERYNPLNIPFIINFGNSQRHVIAVRYSNHHALLNGEAGVVGFTLGVGDHDRNVIWHYINSTITTVIFTFYFTFFFALGFLHLTLYLYYRVNRSNLYYCIFAFTFGTTFLCILIQLTYLDPDTTSSFVFLMAFLSNFYEPALLAMLYSIFLQRIPRYYWIWIGLFALEFIKDVFTLNIPWLSVIVTSVFVIESLRLIISSIIKKRDGAWIIGTGIIATILFFVGYIVLAISGNAQFFQTQSGFFGIIVLVFVVYATVSIPASMTVYLAREFARTSKHLEKQLKEVENLSRKNLEQEREKQQILAAQNELLEKKVKERTAELAEKNKEILDSIHYASRIQKSLLPNEKFIVRVLKDLRKKPD